MKLNTPIVGGAQLTEALIRAGKEVEALRAKMDQLQAREQKGRQYLVDICGIGSEDPMDFLCAAHAYQRGELDSLRAQLAERERVARELVEALQEIADGTVYYDGTECGAGYQDCAEARSEVAKQAIARFHAAEDKGHDA